jgi:hypothetical protein
LNVASDLKETSTIGNFKLSNADLDTSQTTYLERHKTMLRSTARLVAPFAFTIAACSSAEPTSIAPDIVDDSIEPMQSVSDSGWTMTSGTPQVQTNAAGAMDATVRASVSWTGTGSRAAGACLLVRVEVGGHSSENRCGRVEHEWSEPVSCTTASQCTGYAAGIPGAVAYCTAPNNTGPKYCYIRPGTQAQYCVGTPADAQPITAGTRTTGWKGAWDGYGYDISHNLDCYEDYGSFHTYFSKWVMYGCYSGCTGTTPTPSVSSQLTVSANQYFDEWSFVD